MRHSEPDVRALLNTKWRVAQKTKRLDLGIAEVATPLHCCSVTRWQGVCLQCGSEWLLLQVRTVI